MMEMKKCCLVAGFNPLIDQKKDYYFIGVDRGSLYLALKGIIIDASIGDFDSVSEEEFGLITAFSKKIVKLNMKKNDTDLEHALNYAKALGFNDIDIYGCLGGRQDHNLLNIKLLYLNDINITMYDEKNKIFCLNKGTYMIYKYDYKYLSLFAFCPCNVTLKGTYYKLDNADIDIKDNYTTSNEILKESCLVTINKGRVMIIQSRD